MKKIVKRFAAVLVCGAMATVGGQAFGQAHDHDHADGDHAGHDHDEHGDHDHGGESLAYYLPEWKAMHFDDANKAAQHAATVKKMGCEVKQGSHAGHSDVSYRCAQWKTLAVKDHKMAEQWSGWLKASGFDVSHAHADPTFAEGPEAVEFRMVKWKQLHGNGSAEEAQMLDQLKKIGVEVVVENHGNHSDIRFRAPTWRDIHVADHNTADQWMGWLKQNGFETQHEL
ncbi:hypothetical protein Q31b_31720 [Novipirellula aureliae]|uniref:Secreted protein n=1 Tax=Novipirellula aureliae TaxID=2527966 RepID=A0A5C6DV73_9BACT|nr:hypothetical protein [Novipirellula aureliae]TWU39857.1 hypothetical protein Q31b_31720 [Novipirellula aureliae]